MEEIVSLDANGDQILVFDHASDTGWCELTDFEGCEFFEEYPSKEKEYKVLCSIENLEAKKRLVQAFFDKYGFSCQVHRVRVEVVDG